MIVYVIQVSEGRYGHEVSRISNVFTSKTEARKCYEAYRRESDVRFHKIYKQVKQGGCCEDMHGVWGVVFRTKELRPNAWISVTMTTEHVEEEFNGHLSFYVFDDTTVKMMSN